MTEAKAADTSTDQAITDILATIDREREREIVSRRFGLFDRKETLEQVGELLGITRERVRQLEKAVVHKLKATAEQGKLPAIPALEERFLTQLEAAGNIMRITELCDRIGLENTRLERSRVAFIAELCPKLIAIDEDDQHYATVATNGERDLKATKAAIAKIVAAVKTLGKPSSIDAIAKEANVGDVQHTTALASTSKHLANLHGQWGMTRWPEVNPKNIRDKIYVILKEHGKHMHFGDIAEAIKQSSFKRRDVTTQAIHNELIKDKRFVLVGRGIYALTEWGYEKGTVADIITDILKKEGKALHRDEIVKRVLKNRYVKETTILLNLQGKPQFKRVAKATYDLDESSTPSPNA
jgi:hypothetical protein